MGAIDDSAEAEARSRSKIPKWLKPHLTGDAAFKKLPGGVAPGWMNGKADGDPGESFLDQLDTPAVEPEPKKRRSRKK